MKNTEVVSLPGTPLRGPGRAESTQRVPAPKSKYGVRTDKQGKQDRTVDGITFASKREAKRYGELMYLCKAHEIGAIELQPVFPIRINGINIGRYTADFRYEDRRTGETIVEDVKSKPTKTEAFSLRKRIVEALYGIEITVVT